MAMCVSSLASNHFGLLCFNDFYWQQAAEKSYKGVMASRIIDFMACYTRWGRACIEKHGLLQDPSGLNHVTSFLVFSSHWGCLWQGLHQ